MQQDTQQELRLLPNLEGIDAETAKRLQSCLDCEFACSPLRYFLTGKATFLACSKKPLSIRISGFSEPFQSRQLTCCNIDNPEDLEVSMDSCEMLFLPARDPGVLYLKEGMCSVSGPKRSDLAREIDRPARLLDELPRRDPDVVRMDERTFRQTGTISIQSPFTLVILDGQPGAAKL